LIGTTDEPWDEAPEKVAISDAEIDYLLAEVNEFLRKPVRRDEIVWQYSGVRPLFELGNARDNDLSTLTRDYSFEIDHPRAGAAPALNIFGGKLTTHRRLAEHAMRELCRVMPWPQEGITRSEILPGGDFGPAGKLSLERALKERLPWMPEPQIARYVRQFGMRASDLLEDVKTLKDLGQHFGADLYQCEVDFLMRTEWAVAVDDVIWRRSKVGLRLTYDDVVRLRSYLDGRLAQPIPSR
jgi:glycerol-3-phosphate dehydrogenase